LKEKSLNEGEGGGGNELVVDASAREVLLKGKAQYG